MYENIFRGFSNRMEAFLIYQPLIELGKKERYKQYPLVSIGMAVLLFILENMLQHRQQNTYDDIARFIQKLLHENEQIQLSFEEAYDMTIVIVRGYLRNEGQPFQMQYYDFESKQGDLFISLISMITIVCKSLRRKKHNFD